MNVMKTFHKFIILISLIAGLFLITHSHTQAAPLPSSYRSDANYYYWDAGKFYWYGWNTSTYETGRSWYDAKPEFPITLYNNVDWKDVQFDGYVENNGLGFVAYEAIWSDGASAPPRWAPSHRRYEKKVTAWYKRAKTSPVPWNVEVYYPAYTNGNDYWFKPYTALTVRVTGHQDFLGGVQQLDDWVNGNNLNLQGSGINWAAHMNYYGGNSIIFSHDLIDYSFGPRWGGAGSKEFVTDFYVTPKADNLDLNINTYHSSANGKATGVYIGSGKRIRTDGTPPTLGWVGVSGASYQEGNTYWVKPGTNVTIKLLAMENRSGIQSSFLRLGDSQVDYRVFHNYDDPSWNNMSPFYTINGNYYWDNNNPDITYISGGREIVQADRGQVAYTIRPNTNNHIYDIQYYFGDHVGNVIGYSNTGSRLGVDGEGPIVTPRTNEDVRDYYNEPWINKTINVRMKFTDPLSGYKRSRYAWSNSTQAPTSWSDWSTSNNYVATQPNNGEWYLHVQSEDNLGNVSTTYLGPYQVDKEGPNIITRTNEDDRDYTKQEWINKQVIVRMKFNDSLSGYKESRYAWSQSTTLPTSWSDWSTSNNYVATQPNNGEWYLHIQAVDNAGNVTTRLTGPYKVDTVIPQHLSYNMTYTYKNGNDYWVKPNTEVFITFRQYDEHSGNQAQTLQLMEDGTLDLRGSHYFNKADSDFYTEGSSPYLRFNSVREIEDNGHYSTLKWSITPTTHGKNYDVRYFYLDFANNHTEYTDTGMNLRVDGVGPVIQFRNSSDTADFASNNLPNSNVTVKLKFNDLGSGYNKSRFVWSQSTTVPTNGWSSWSTSNNYNVTMSESGEWYLYVQAEDNVGNSVTTRAGIYKTNSPPTADFNYNPSTIYNDTTVSFTNLSSDPDGQPLTYQWAYQEPGTTVWVDFSTEKNPTKVLNIKGTWNIRLTVTDPSGATDSVIKSATVINRPPVADFNYNPSTIYNDTTVKFTNLSTDRDKDVLTYQWAYLQPGSTTWTNFSTEKNPSKIFNLVGTWNIKLTVTDSNGASRSVTKNIEVVNRKPIVEVSYKPLPPNEGDTIYEGDTVRVCVKITDPDGHPTNVNINIKKDGKQIKNDVKNGMPSGSQECVDVNTDEGKYDITVTADDGFDVTEIITWFYSKPLSITGHVNHTSEWEQKHIAMGHDLKYFYSGEKFMLSADTSPYPIEYVKSTFLATQSDGLAISREVSMIPESRILYKGSLYDEKFLNYPTNIKNGPASFTFEVKYKNGVIKQSIVNIEIIDDVYNVYNIHRRY